MRSRFTDVAIVTLCYASVAIGLDLMIAIGEHARGVPDPHRDVVLAVFRLLCAAAWLWSMASVMAGARGGTDR